MKDEIIQEIAKGDLSTLFNLYSAKAIDDHEMRKDMNKIRHGFKVKFDILAFFDCQETNRPPFKMHPKNNDISIYGELIDASDFRTELMTS